MPMSRTPVAATARLERISVRATESEIASLDRLRGAITRSDFIRQLVRDELTRRQGPRPATHQEFQ